MSWVRFPDWKRSLISLWPAPPPSLLTNTSRRRSLLAVYLGMGIICGMQLFRFCRAQCERLWSSSGVLLPTGACSGTNFTLSPCGLSRWNLQCRQLLLSSGPWSLSGLCSWKKTQQKNTLHFCAVRITQRRINIITTSNVLLEKGPLIRGSLIFILKDACFVPQVQLSLDQTCVCLSVCVCVHCFSLIRCIKTSSSIIQGPSFVFQSFIVSLAHVL